MRHVAILGDNLESFNRLRIPHYVVQVDWTVFLHPGIWEKALAKVVSSWDPCMWNHIPD